MELEELVKWISELSAEEPGPAPQPLPRDAWQAVGRDLGRASEKFAEAHVALLAGDGGAVLAELARDLERETEGLALRAHVLSRRAPREPKPEREREPSKPEPVPLAAAAPATGDKVKEHEDHRRVSPKSATDLLRSAQGTVETAHEKLGAVERPDRVCQRFEEELDVLAEMTLSLRQQSERLADEGGER
jgi:hypothetical protein